ncbi:hypothetical protein O3M35_011500 [Rhynocoris fuscipes]|uniref:U5 small nuclear ribonucleoprotein TSSC4 n=1 Tax=Rhynocoris fuscipes TaxID=488301 RepID=A0AAW1D2L4_9HEMI
MFDQAKNFYLQGNQDFKDRQKSIFHAVDELSAKNPENRFSRDELKEKKVPVVKDKRDLKQFLGKESIFKRPEVPLKKFMKLKIPEFIKSPHKWKLYSLGDDIISDQSNRMVAMSFLKDLSERTKNETNNIENDISKPVFNKFIKDTGTNLAVNDINEKSTFINGKTIMPEYVVGQKKQKKEKAKKKESEISSNTSVKLDHLLNDE